MASLESPGVRDLLDEPNHASAWPSNLDRDPRVTALVFDASSAYEYVEVRGVPAATDAADELIDQLAKKYIGQDTHPFRQPGEQRVEFLIAPDRVRHVKQ